MRHNSTWYVDEASRYEKTLDRSFPQRCGVWRLSQKWWKVQDGRGGRGELTVVGECGGVEGGSAYTNCSFR